MNNFIHQLYSHKLVRYLLVGGSTFALDLGLLFMLHEAFHIHLAIATTIAYWWSVLFNFSLTRFWTFSDADKTKLYKHITLYGCLLGFNYLFTVIFVTVISNFIFYGWAKTLAAAIQTCWNYYVYKKFIFV